MNDQSELESTERTGIGERLLQHGIHEENVFYNRLNFFLLFESVLFSAFLSAQSSDRPLSSTLAWTVVGLGLLSSVFWLVVQYDKLMLVKTLVKRIVEYLPEFGETIRQAQAKRGANIRATEALALVTPSMFVGVWSVVAYAIV